MDQLLGKIVNLSYEFFGVFMPGFVMVIFLSLWWWALGPLAPLWTSNAVAPMDGAMILSVAYAINTRNILAEGVSVLVMSYFLGHFLLLVARSGEPDQDAKKKWTRRVVLALTFRIPKSQGSYNEDLQRLFARLSVKFSDGEGPLNWRQLYPVVKSYLAQNLKYSLVTTYQNKYTLHRSMTTAGALMFWLSVSALVGAFATACASGTDPHWIPLTALAIFALAIVIGFSKSYMDNWEMFGNAILTEAFAIIYGPKHESGK
jgi:hypothetical protein